MREDYYFQMVYDDLPFWGFIGRLEKLLNPPTTRYYVFNHFQYEIFYNKDRIIEIKITTDDHETVSALRAHASPAAYTTLAACCVHLILSPGSSNRLAHQSRLYRQQGFVADVCDRTLAAD